MYELFRLGLLLEINMARERDRIIRAASAGDFSLVKQLVTAQPDENLANASDVLGHTLLMFACAKGNTASASFLLENGANKDAINYLGKTVFMLACQNGDEKMASFLLENGANMHLTDDAGKNALMLACENGHAATVLFLLEKGAHKDATDKAGKTALMLACLLVAWGADFNLTRHKERWNPLMIASMHGFFPVADLLLLRGADVNYSDEDGNTPLMAATLVAPTTTEEALVYKAQIAELLIKRGAIIDQRSKSGTTALAMACHAGNKPAQQLLLASGANSCIPNHNGDTTLMWAVIGRSEKKREGMVQALLENDKAGFLVQMRRNEGQTALSMALTRSDWEIARQLANSMSPDGYLLHRYPILAENLENPTICDKPETKDIISEELLDRSKLVGIRLAWMLAVLNIMHSRSAAPRRAAPEALTDVPGSGSVSAIAPGHLVGVASDAAADSHVDRLNRSRSSAFADGLTQFGTDATENSTYTFAR
jgi:ankyrin repeat protein